MTTPTPAATPKAPNKAVYFVARMILALQLDPREMTAVNRDCVNAVCSILFLSLSVSMILMGAIYINNCPAEPFIPIYMIVAGIIFILRLVIQFGKLLIENYKKEISIALVFVEILNFTGVIIGSMHLEQCPAEPHIPIYMIVTGILSLIQFQIQYSYQQLPEDRRDRRQSSPLGGLVDLFMFMWHFMEEELDSLFDKSYNYFGILGVIILLFMEYLIAVLQISSVFIGVTYAHECPAEKNIPVYMVGTGCFLLFRAILKSISCGRPRGFLRSCCEYLDIAEAFWMIFGADSNSIFEKKYSSQIWIQPKSQFFGIAIVIFSVFLMCIGLLYLD
uniref:Uncharacterized protein n=1 Tax=Strigamia maritima TaxID=126957 RepID=T1IPP7_STRMM